MVAALLFVVGSQAVPGPVVPAGLNPHFYQAVRSVEERLAAGEFQKAAQAARALPQTEIAIVWDESKVPQNQRLEFREARDKALRLWGRALSTLKFSIATSGGDLKFSFAPNLPPQAGSAVRPGAVHFYSDGIKEPRLETVIALARSEKLNRTEAPEVFNEVSFAIASYLGVGQHPIFGPANSRTDASTTAETQLNMPSVTAARAAKVVADELRNAILKNRRLTPSKPTIRLDPLTYTGGPLMQGETVDFALQANNIGTGTLVMRVDPDCGCLSVVPTGQAPAGGTHIIRARFDSAEFVGDVRKRLFVYTNDAENPMIEVPVQVKVVPRFRLLSEQPRTILMKDGGMTVEFFLALSENAGIAPTEVVLDGVPGDVTYAPWEGSLADPELGEAAKPRKGYKFTVKLQDVLPPGRHVATVQIATGHPRFPVIRHSMQLQKGIIALPMQVYFGEVSIPKRMRFLLSRPGVPFNIVRIESSSPYLKAEFVPGKAEEHRVTVQYDGKADAGDHSGMLTVHTDDPAQPKVLVPVRLVAR